MWTPTADEIAYYKRNAKLDNVSDEYITDQLPLLLEHVNEECEVQFNHSNLPANVKMFIIGALNYFGSAQYGLESEKMGSVSFSYDFSEMPKSLKDLLAKYGYGRKRNGARYHVL